MAQISNAAKVSNANPAKRANRARPGCARPSLRSCTRSMKCTASSIPTRFPAGSRFAKGLKGKVGKGKRAAVAHVAKLLEEAHIEHTDEFFHMKAIWVAMEGVHCATAAGEEKATATAGSSAWTFEAAALRQLAGLFGVKQKIEYPVGPYV